MRKSILAPFLLAALCLAATAATAVPIGAPAQALRPRSFSVSALVGFALRDVHEDRDSGIGEMATSSRLLVKATFAPTRFLDLYGTVGAADWRMREAGLESVLGVWYGGGFRLRVFPWFWQEDGFLNVEIDAQALALSTSSGSANAGAFGNRDVRVGYWEYQGTLLVSKRFEVFVPFVGVCYNRSGVHFVPGGSRNSRPDFDWGALVGLEYSITPQVYFTGEVHIFTENSFYLGAGFAY